MNKRNYIPREGRPERKAVAAIDARKRLFERFNQLARSRNGWFTTVPGAREMMFDCLPSSDLPQHLRDLGYDVCDGASASSRWASSSASPASAANWCG